MDLNSRIFIAGHLGLVGSAVVRNLKAKGYNNLILKPRSELDLLNQAAVNKFFKEEKIEYAIIAAAKVGGILFNKTYQAEFLYENIMIAGNIIHAAFEHGVEKLLYLGSSCIYPRLAPQPLKEEYLLSGPLEPTNEGYALAKIAGLKMCEKYNLQYGKRFVSVMPTNLYGSGDNFHPDHSHVIPGMMRRFHVAKLNKSKEVIVWGSGTPKREFLHVDDLAESLYVVMQKYEEPTVLNIGSGIECTIKELAELMRDITEFEGDIVFDSSKPDGTPRKVLDTTRINALGWQAKYSLKDGLADTYKWALSKGVFNLE